MIGFDDGQRPSNRARSLWFVSDGVRSTDGNSEQNAQDNKQED
jgi:hypothetical protein